MVGNAVARGSRDSRGLILEAAREEFGRYGPAGSRLERVARRAGVNKQLIFYYFGSKAGLLQAVAEAAWSRVEAALTARADDSPWDALRLLVGRLATSASENRDVIRMALATSSDPADPVREVTRTVVGRLEQRLRELISEGQGLGYLRDDMDPAAAARLVLAGTLGWIALPPDDRPEDTLQPIGLLLQALTW
jgi:TetR/AcrR family transcriptional regulator